MEETLYSGDSTSAVIHRNGVAPNLLYCWRRLMLEEESIAVTGDDSVISDKSVQEMETRLQELERQLGRKTLESEILKEAPDKARLYRADDWHTQKVQAHCSALPGDRTKFRLHRCNRGSLRLDQIRLYSPIKSGPYENGLTTIPRSLRLHKIDMSDRC